MAEGRKITYLHDVQFAGTEGSGRMASGDFQPYLSRTLDAVPDDHSDPLFGATPRYNAGGTKR